MTHHSNSIVRFSALLLAFMLPTQIQALTLSDEPLFLSSAVKPLVMLDISKDQQLYKKAFNDYSDLDGDGQIETTYDHDIDYYGYFDPRKCYAYSSGSKRFEPNALANTKYCDGTTWSGNFLNWASMSRMDAVRKLLYGGLRSPTRTNGDGSGISDGDTATSTVLERAYLPTDAHSWAKYYDGDDLAQLTPYSPPTTSTTSSTSLAITNTGSNTVSYAFTVASTTGFATNDFVLAKFDADNYLKGKITAIAGSIITISVTNTNYANTSADSRASWSLKNLSKAGITLCNTTLGGGTPQDKSQTNTNLPRLRIAKGNYSLWNANERWQCSWSGEKNSANSNNFDQSGVAAYSSNPTIGDVGTGTGLGDYFVRVQACVANLIGSEKCKQYPDGNLKPIGLLQVYGDIDQLYFGLMTGSYDNNISGGVLRKNMGTFTNEVNTTTNGTFKTDIVGIVRTLDKLRIYGYNYSDGTYTGSGGDNCNFQQTSITEGNCTSWGNPMAEVYYESLRYFAGAGSPTPAYSSTSTKDTVLGLPRPSWTQPLSNANYCAPLNTLVFNASVSTNDFDLADTSMSVIGSDGHTAASLADIVGTGEDIAGNSYFIGSINSTAGDAGNNELCNAKTVGNLGSIKGICPEGPTLLGSYLMPGMAFHARVNRIRDDLSAVPDDDTTSLKVATYGIQLATNVPRIPIALSGETTPRVILQPIYRMFETPPQGGGSLVEMKILDQSATATTAKGSIYVNWEDSEQGGDYDQDMWGIIRYCLTTVADGCGAGTAANTLRVTTDAIAESTGNPQGFGYTTSGTTQDGPHFHSGIEGYDYTDPTGNIGCTNCKLSDAATTATYTLTGTVANELKDPLYYAAKWGGFNNTDATIGPNLVDEWDVLDTAGEPGTDGIPDNYFLVSNPLGLETALNAAFLKILRDSSASAVATNSTTLKTGSRIYQGRFSSSFWTGQLLSYNLSEAGVITSAATPPPAWGTDDTPYPEWDAGQEIMKQIQPSTTNPRVILTYGNSGTGADFQYANLSSNQQDALNLNLAGQQDNCGPERVAYFRGDQTDEGIGTLSCDTAPAVAIPLIVPEKFRVRDVSILGDIINSNPAFVGAPSAGYSDVDHPGYSAFRSKFNERTPMSYVGANDGMLHGFNASVDSTDVTLPGVNAGQEELAYVPSMVFGNLSRLTDSAYKHRYFVDSSPMVADACVSTTSTCSANWKTVLVSGLGGGGKGFFALNVTNPLDSANNDPETPVFSTANAANIVLWEFTNSNDADLGYTFNLAPINIETGQSKQIAKFENGRWGVVVGNGYNSSNGKAVLYVLFLSGPTGASNAWQASGTDYMKIEADAGPDNGLSTPTLFDSDANGLMDTAYAGDLKGNVWKFDLSAANPASWGLAIEDGEPLYSATDSLGNAQPITTPVVATLHPSGGKMVLFGTGKYLETSDSTSASVQSLYGIRDENAAVSGRSELTPQITSASKTAIDGVYYRTSSQGCDADSATALPACPASSKGWYTDLPISGERATGSPQLIASVAWFSTFIPSTSACDFGGSGWLIPVDYITGGMPSYPVFDTNNDDVIDGNDEVVAGMELGAMLGGATFIEGILTDVAIASTVEGETPVVKVDLSGGTEGRITWREIVQ